MIQFSSQGPAIFSTGEHIPRGTIQKISVITEIFQIVPRGCVQKSVVVHVSIWANSCLFKFSVLFRRLRR